MKLVVLDGYTLNPGDLSWDGLQNFGDLTVYDRTPVNSQEEIVERAADAEIIFTNKTPLTKETLEMLPKVKYIGVLATGYNVVNIQAAKDLGIVVANVPSYGNASVAQMTIALLLEMCHHVGHHSDAVKAGRWANSKDFCFWDYPLIELEGKTLGIVGFGRIGQTTAKMAQAFGMNILAYNRTPKKELESDNLRFVDLDELYAKSDVISLHCPLTEQNQGMINKESIAKMKDRVMIINTARGPLVEEQDLADALNSGKVGAAAVDVVSVEPIQTDNPLLTAKNCIITPHIAWAPIEARSRLMDIAVANVDAFIKGNPVNVVNP
ncbi:glycerate dehydrogenase [Desulfuribacillus stibiiarsenatis]|uniref:Glycerate dehydrogenase n=1 Tax=Desulfuribacillus stibiiarsenatis TaxID=1390249 RepID=A0A1E5L4V8_9FIRM|nr:D-2-hydroxyacid dehydrogenase [Desulfuribacillus stibiiarsenatis]OEH85098.1 glycerate dehydrogenase [Desulfuribacillus stibiiarsenatis]